jgi:vitamin B12 transporter
MKKNLLFVFKYQWRKPACFAVLLFLSLPVTVSAQTDTTNKIKEVQVNTTAIPIAPVIVPSQTVSANEFIRYNALTVADAIRDFSGVTIKDYGGIGGLKTISVRGLGANHTSVLFDGIQMNDAENGLVDLGRLNLINTNRVTLYNGQPPVILQTARAFAAASVLSIETIKPNFAATKPYQITAGIKTGSFGLVNPYFTMAATLKRQMGISYQWIYRKCQRQIQVFVR